VQAYWQQCLEVQKPGYTPDQINSITTQNQAYGLDFKQKLVKYIETYQYLD
jgi:cell fate (sporulation/competence/biofilm development) regulator YlbF (YheA/YmcA/DUF963 family)